MFSFPKPPSGTQFKENAPVLLQNANVRIVEAVGGYPVALNPDTNDVFLDGPLCKPAAAAALRKSISDFLVNAMPYKFKRWGEVVKAYMAASKKPATELTPYPQLRDILLSLTKDSTGAATPASSQDTEVETLLKENETTKEKKNDIILKEKESNKSNSKKRSANATPAATNKRLKLSDVNNEDEFANITTDQWLLALTEINNNPKQFARENSFVWTTAQRLLAFFKLTNSAQAIK